MIKRILILLLFLLIVSGCRSANTVYNLPRLKDLPKDELAIIWVKHDPLMIEGEIITEVCIDGETTPTESRGFRDWHKIYVLPGVHEIKYTYKRKVQSQAPPPERLYGSLQHGMDRMDHSHKQMSPEHRQHVLDTDMEYIYRDAVRMVAHAAKNTKYETGTGTVSFEARAKGWYHLAHSSGINEATKGDLRKHVFYYTNPFATTAK